MSATNSVFNIILLSLMNNVDGPQSDLFMMRSSQWPDEVRMGTMPEDKQCIVASNYILKLATEAGVEDLDFFNAINQLHGMKTLQEFDTFFNQGVVRYFELYKLPAHGV